MLDGVVELLGKRFGKGNACAQRHQFGQDVGLDALGPQNGKRKGALTGVGAAVRAVPGPS